MSLYNKLFGINDEGPVLLGMLGLNMEYFDRFRDVFLKDKGTKIIVYTRTGGNNRESHQENWEKIKSNELYITDFDDAYDNTYAYVEFNIPDKYKETAKKMFKEEPISVDEKFKKECEEMNNPNSEAYKRAKSIVDMIINGKGGYIEL